MIRRQLAVHSPLPPRALLSGVAAALTGGRAALRGVTETLGKRHGARGVLLTDSGTSALTLAFRAVAGEHPGRPVALPAYCCYDVATAAAGAEVPVLLYDLEPETLGPDPDSLREAVDAGAAAIVVAHLYGVPVDLSPVLDLAAEAGVPVVEDAAQAAGATYRGRALGSFGSVSVLSFGRGKGTTGGGGGALLAHDERGAEWVRRASAVLPERRARGLRRLPGLVGQWLFGRPELYGIPAALPFLHLGETVYRDPSPPGRMSALSAGTLAVTLGEQEAELDARRAHASRLAGIVASLDGVVTVRPPRRSTPGHLRLPVLAEGLLADRLAGDEARRAGVARGYPRPLDRLAAMEDLCLNRATARPGAEELSTRLFTLPVHSRLDDAGLRRLEAVLGARRERSAVRSTVRP